MQILDLLGIYFDAVVVCVTNSSLLFRFSVAILNYVLSISIPISRKLVNNENESAKHWYDCPTLKLPNFETCQAKLKASKKTFLGCLFFAITNLIMICFSKPVKFFMFDVVFPAVDVYTDSDAAIKHFE